MSSYVECFLVLCLFFFFSSRRRHTRSDRDWSSDVCSSDLDIRLVPCPTFEELFRAVEQGDAARGAVPIENSLAGSVHENYDLLGAHALHVVAETQVRVRHCLIARPGTERAAIHRVASHPVALAQCRRFFATHPDVVAVPAYDTAGRGRPPMAGRPPAAAPPPAPPAAPACGGPVPEERPQGPP